MNNKKNLVVILGPTAVGKTRFAAELSHLYEGEIISADSRQVYKHMNLGTGKDYEDYIINNVKINYHLIDIIEPEKEFNLFLFIKYFITVFDEISSKNKIPFLTGGTGLYLSAILNKYNLCEATFDKNEIDKLTLLSEDELKTLLISMKPNQHNITDISSRERMISAIIIEQNKGKTISTEKLKLNPVIIGINPGRKELKKRISVRLKKRLQEGMIEEVEYLLKKGISFEKLEFFGLEYKYISLYLQGKLNYNDMFQKLNSAIVQFAKRQMTWFRKIEREFGSINWLDSADIESGSKILSENGFSKKIP